MKSAFVLCFFVFETWFLSFGNAKSVYLDSSSASIAPVQTIRETVIPIRTTEDVPTRIKHIPRETDQSSAKATAVPTMTPSLPIEVNNSTKSDFPEATLKKNSTGPTLELDTEKTVVKHIPRKRQTFHEVTMPFNFQTLHMPCDMDLPFNHIYRMPAHCKWMYNNRYQSASHWRAYNLYKAEAFFFGQYHERLRRYELDEHVFSAY